MAKFESTIVLGRVGEDPEVAGAAVRRVVQWARDRGSSKLGFRSVKVARSSIVIEGDLNGDATQQDVREAMAILGGELKAIVNRRGAPLLLPKSAED